MSDLLTVHYHRIYNYYRTKLVSFSCTPFYIYYLCFLKHSDKLDSYTIFRSGFTKVAYWDVEKVKKHASKFSQAYRAGYNSPWKSDFDAMAMKTVLKSILKFAPKSIEMQNAVTFDQAVINTNTSDVQDLDIDAFTPEYIDNIESEKKEMLSAKAAEAAEADAAKKKEEK